MLLARCRYAPAVDEPPDAAGVDSSASMFIQSAAQRRPVGGGAPPNIFLPSRPASVYFFSLSTTDLIADVYRLLPGFTQRNGPPWPHIPTPSISLYRVLLGFFFTELMNRVPSGFHGRFLLWTFSIGAVPFHESSRLFIGAFYSPYRTRLLLFFFCI